MEEIQHFREICLGIHRQGIGSHDVLEQRRAKGRVVIVKVGLGNDAYEFVIPEDRKTPVVRSTKSHQSFFEGQATGKTFYFSLHHFSRSDIDQRIIKKVFLGQFIAIPIQQPLVERTLGKKIRHQIGTHTANHQGQD